MNKKLLITSGDSWSDPEHSGYQQNNIRVWPEKVADFMDWDLLNVGRVGEGNDYIYNAAVDAILENQDRDIVVFPFWSQPNRLNMWNAKVGIVFIPDRELYEKTLIESSGTGADKGVYDINYYRVELQHDIQKYFEGLNDICCNLYKDKNEEGWSQKYYDYMLLHCSLSSLRSVYLLDDFCKKRNIEILHNAALPVSRCPHWVLHKESVGIDKDNEKNDRFLAELKKNMFYDLLENIENKVVDSFFDGKHAAIEKYKKYHISEIDKHPNQKGHDLIAYDFIRKYEEIFNRDDEYVTPVFVYD